MRKPKPTIGTCDRCDYVRIFPERPPGPLPCPECDGGTVTVEGKGKGQKRPKADPEPFKRACKHAGLPIPEPEFYFAKPERLWRFDWAWPDHKVALEIEGGGWTGGRHTSGKGFHDDMAKYNHAAILGWRLIRCTPKEFRKLTVLDILTRVLKQEATP